MRRMAMLVCAVALLGSAGLVSQTVDTSAQVPWILRLLVTSAMHSGPTGEPRSEYHARLAQGNYFNTIPRSIGQTFVVVASASRFNDANVLADNSIRIPILFHNDPTARVPNLIIQEIDSKCPDGWATLQFVGGDASEESFSITCGLRTGSSPSSVVRRAPDRPGEIEGPKSRTVNYLEVTLDSFEVSRQGEIRATLKLKNIDARLGMAVALKALHSDGIADFWKFFPISDGRLNDNAGGSYNLQQASGVGFAREPSDWAILRAGEETFVTLVFSGEARPGTSFNLTFGIWMGYRAGPANEQRQGSYSIHLADIRPRRF